jgi:hypothetical protein
MRFSQAARRTCIKLWAGFGCGLLGLEALAQAAGPRLAIETTPGQSVRVSWTNNSNQVLLQQANSLKPPVAWLNSPTSPVLQGNLFAADIVATGREQYFRLEGPTVTQISSTSPLDREQGVSVNRETIFYFSQPLATSTAITADHFFARLGQRTILSRIELSSDHRKATLFYLEPIPGGARLTVTFDASGVKDQFGQEVDADGDGKPGGVRFIQFDTYSTTPVPGTAIIGHVFASERVPDGKGDFTNQPLERVTITVDGAEETLRTTTDAQGAFALTNCPAGRFFVHIDGRTVTNGIPNSNLLWSQRAYYPVVGKAWEAVPGRADNLASGTGEIFLPLIPAGTLQPVSATNDTLITFAPSVLAANPQLEGVEITVPANSLFSDDGKRGGLVGIAPVAPDRLPEPLPAGLDHVLDITVQTDGPSNFDRPVPACFPNLPDHSGNTFAPGEKAVLMSYNHDIGQWEVVGSMTTSADGKLVCTDPGVGIRQPGWHGVQPTPYEPLPPTCSGGGTGGAPQLVRDDKTGSGGRSPASIHPTDVPLAPLDPCAPDDCTPWTHGAQSQKECIDDAGSLYDFTKQQCEQNYHDRCLPCLDRSCLRRCNNELRQCLRHAHDVLVYLIFHCVNAPDYCYEDTNPSSSSLKDASPAANPVDAILDQIDQLVLGTAPDGVTPEIQAQMDALVAEATAAAGGNLSTFLESEILGSETHLLADGVFQNLVGRAPPYPVYYMAEINRPSGPLELRGMTAAFGQYQIFVPRGSQLKEVSFYDPKTQTFGMVHPFRLPELSFKLPRVTLLPLHPDELDTDGDGLPDLVEAVIGTDPNNADTDGDGIPDGVEVANGTNPLDGRPAALGVFASADTPGLAQDICVVNNLAAIADGPAGVALFDVTNPLNPVRVAQIQTRAPATAVTCSGNFVVAAQGAKGAAIIDISNAENAFDAKDVAVNGAAVAVAAADGRAYVGTSNGLITIVDLLSGLVLDRIHTASPVHDLAIRDGILFVALESEFRTYQVAGPIRTLSGVALSVPADPFSGRRRLFVGTTYAQVSNLQGFDNFDIRNPALLQLVALAQRVGPTSFEQIVDTGSGLGLAAAGANVNTTAHDIYLYDLSVPTDTGRLLTIFPMPGVAYAVTIHNGLALVADGAAGLQVVNYRAFDANRKSAAISLQVNFPLTTPTAGQVETGQIVHVLANASDDVQVRNVEFYLDGALVTVDGNFPFEYRFSAPALTATKTSFTLRARALDTGGNVAATDEITVTLRPDTTSPRILQTVPPAGTILGSVNSIGVIFSEPVNGSQLNGTTLQVHSFGPDGLVGTADDLTIGSTSITYLADLNEAVISFASNLAPGTYVVLAQPPLADSHGNVIRAQFSGAFFVIPGQDSDQDGVPDAVELSLGLDPHNPDSNGNGVPDGLEDFDGDGLPNAYEVLLGTDPTKPDTNGNGVKDGDEDFDGDGLTNRQEFALGTNPLLADSDGDGWNDEAELTAGTDPLDPNSIPAAGFLAQPPVRVVAPNVGSLDGLPFNTSIAQPPVNVVIPALGSPGDLPYNTFLAEPPVQVRIE